MRSDAQSFKDWCIKNDPDLLSEWSSVNNINPSSISKSSSHKCIFVCDKGHTYQSSPRNKVLGSKCPICAGKKAMVGVNDLKSLCPSLASEWSSKNRTKPEQYTLGSHFEAIWVCSEGHIWKARIDSRVRGTGCPYCNHRRISDKFGD